MRGKKAILVLSLIITFVLTQTGLSQNSSNIEDSIPKEAAKAIEAGNWQEVIKILQLPASKADAPEPVLYWYGVAQFNVEKYPYLCIKPLQRAMELRPESRITAQYLARAAGKMSVYEDALKIIESLLVSFGDDPVVLQSAAKIHRNIFFSRYNPSRDMSEAASHIDKAQKYLETAISIDPSNYQLHLDLVDILDIYGKRDLAIKHLLVTDRLVPLGYEAYVMLGQLYSKTGDHDNACDAFELAIEMCPSSSHEVEWDLGLELMEAERYERAVEIFRDVFARDNKHMKARFMMGKAAYMDGNYPTALFGFREAYKVDHNLDGLAWSSRCAYDLGQDDLSLELINRAFNESKVKNYDSHWHFIRGRALWQMGDKKAAINDLEEAATYNPENEEYAKWAIYGFRQLKDPFGVLRIARAYGNSVDPDEALSVIRNLRKMWVIFPPTKDHRGKTYRGGITGQTQKTMAEMYDEKGLYKTAAALLEMAGWNSKGTINSWACWVMYRGGNHDEARKMFGELANRKSTTKSQKEWGYQGLAFMSLLNRDGNTARKNAELYKSEYNKHMTDTVIKWADVYTGKEGAVEKLDKFDLLGIYSTYFSGSKFNKGFVVGGILPDCPLVKTQPSIQFRDVVIRVGDRYLNCRESIENLRKEKINQGKTTVIVQRGDKTFSIDVDFSEARRGLTKGISK